MEKKIKEKRNKKIKVVGLSELTTMPQEQCLLDILTNMEIFGHIVLQNANTRYQLKNIKSSMVVEGVLRVVSFFKTRKKKDFCTLLKFSLT